MLAYQAVALFERLGGVALLGNGAIRPVGGGGGFVVERYSLIGGMMPQEVGSDVSEAQARPRSSLFLLPEDPDVELLAIFLAPFQPTCCHALFHDDNGLNL